MCFISLVDVRCDIEINQLMVCDQWFGIQSVWWFSDLSNIHETSSVLQGKKVLGGTMQWVYDVRT